MGVNQPDLPRVWYVLASKSLSPINNLRKHYMNVNILFHIYTLHIYNAHMATYMVKKGIFYIYNEMHEYKGGMAVKTL